MKRNIFFVIIICLVNACFQKKNLLGSGEIYKICWVGESAFSSIEQVYDFNQLIDGFEYTDYRKMSNKIIDESLKRPYKEDKPYYEAEIQKKIIIINLKDRLNEIFFVEKYYYIDDIISKIQKEFRNWKIIVNIEKDSKNNWSEEKLIYNPEENLIFHILYSQNTNREIIEKIIFEDSDQYKNRYWHEFIVESHAFYQDYDNHNIQCIN